MKKLFCLIFIAAMLFSCGCSMLNIFSDTIEKQAEKTPQPEEEKYVEIKDGKELVHAYCYQFDDESFDVMAMFDELQEQDNVHLIETSNISQPYYPCKVYLFYVRTEGNTEYDAVTEYFAQIYEYEDSAKAKDAFEKQMKQPGEESISAFWECFRGVLLRINNFVISGMFDSGYDDVFYSKLPDDVQKQIKTVEFDLKTSIKSLNKSAGKSSPEKKTELFKSAFEQMGASAVTEVPDIYTDVFLNGHMVGRCFIHEDGCDRETAEYVKGLFEITDRGVVYLYHDDGFICMVLPEYAELIEYHLSENSEA